LSLFPGRGKMTCLKEDDQRRFPLSAGSAGGEICMTDDRGRMRRTVRAIFVIVLVGCSFSAAAIVNAGEKDDELIRAAYGGSIEDVERLLREGANVNARELGDGATPLIVATQRENVSLVRLLLSRGANVNAKDDRGQTALMYVAKDEIARLLIQRGADINEKGDEGMTMLGRAASEGRLDIVRLLLGRGVSLETPDSFGRTPLIAAIDQGFSEVARALIQHRSNVNAQDARGWTPLIHAASVKDKGIVKLLLEKGADPNVRNKTGYAALMYASDDADICKILLDKGANVDIRGVDDDVTPLIKASVEGQYRVVEELLKRKADVNARDKDGNSALHWALKFSHHRVAQLLKDHGGTE
jgi:uncharacterized protein